jgi:hypothetical protein
MYCVSTYTLEFQCDLVNGSPGTKPQVQ